MASSDNKKSLLNSVVDVDEVADAAVGGDEVVEDVAAISASVISRGSQGSEPTFIHHPKLKEDKRGQIEGKDALDIITFDLKRKEEDERI
jgi:hypothetical protein